MKKYFLKNKWLLVCLFSFLVILVVMYVNYQYGLYLLRWQFSTPTLAIFSAVTVAKLSNQKLKWATKYEWSGAVVANLVGGFIFYWIDKILIFKT